MLNVFHISDLHFTGRKTGQLRDAATASVRSILELAVALKADGTLSNKVCIVLTGDIVQSGGSPMIGDQPDFDAVQDNLLAPLLALLGVGPERVFLVPGNHELDRDAVSEDARLVQGHYPTQKVCEADIAQDLSAKLSSFFNFVKQNGYCSVTVENARIATFECDGQQIVCLNGLAGSYSRSGYGDKGELFVLPSELAGDFTTIGKNAIVLTHHPLSWYADTCANDLKEFFSARQCRVFTGHIHDRGIDWTETSKGGFVTVQAGASAEVGSANQVAVAWLPASDSIAVRHYALDTRAGGYPITPASETKVAPEKARQFLERTEAFFDPAIIYEASEIARAISESELLLASGRSEESYVPPDITRFPADQFSGQRTNLPGFEADKSNRVISGDELSGKSSLLQCLAVRCNTPRIGYSPKIAIVLDYRIIESSQDLGDYVIKRLMALGLSHSQSDYIVSVGKVEIFFDNFDPNSSAALQRFQSFFEKNSHLRWTVAARGSQRYMPSRAPAAFSKDGVTYYQLVETTLPTVLRMIEKHESGCDHEKPRAIVEQVFRSINNLRAPRTIFYVNSMIDVFLSDGSVEPLNRYLLIENLLSDRIRAAHKDVLPNQPVDMEMIETFIGLIAYELMNRSESYITKAQFYKLVDDFVERKGIQKKRFDADKILQILTLGFVIRDYEVGFGFMMLSVEDYFLAKHMGKDPGFRSYIMSTEGLLTYPSVAEFYVAQNPSDRPRIDEILALIDGFQEDVSSVVAEIRDSSVAAIRGARPGGSLQLEDGIIDRLGEIEDADEPTSVRFEEPKPVGRTKRVRFAAEERGAVFLQLGASILGVTRTLDQSERVEIFDRLKGVLLTSLHSLPMIAQHLADGGEISFRGNSLKADYVGELAVPEDRFYLILRSMVYSLYKSFATWSGSPSFFNAALKLRRMEADELVKSALFAQNIEADLSEALSFIPDISSEVESLLLKEVLVRLYVDAMTLVPLERADEKRAIDKLVDVTLELKPPSVQNEAALNNHRARLRKHFTDRIGFNAYVGRLVKISKH